MIRGASNILAKAGRLLFLAVTTLEFLNAAGGIYVLTATGVKRMVG